VSNFLQKEGYQVKTAEFEIGGQLRVSQNGVPVGNVTHDPNRDTITITPPKGVSETRSKSVEPNSQEMKYLTLWGGVTTFMRQHYPVNNHENSGNIGVIILRGNRSGQEI
jgi:hypothetical protein